MNNIQNPKVSVIIPSYNHGDYIKEAIESVLVQDFTDFELIIVDDASSDQSVEVISTFHDPRIKFHKFIENKGAVETLNYGIKLSRGNYIALLNSDDSWEKGKLSTQVKILDEDPQIGIVFTNASFVDENNQILSKKDYPWADVFLQPNRESGEWLEKFFFELNCICHPSMLIRKELYSRHGLYNPGLRQLPDFSKWVNLFKYTNIRVLEEPFVRFRILSQDRNTSADTSINRTRNRNELYFIMHDFFDNVSDEIFIKGFQKHFRKSGLLSQEELLCERAFMYFNIPNEIAHIYKLIGIKKINDLMTNPTLNKVLKESYSFSDKEFFEITGSFSLFDYGEHPVVNTVIKSAKSGLRKNQFFFKMARKIYHKMFR
ncbi:glycosyltransferase [Paenibacillus sp. 1P03SA]|uniref:glycosyltransferase n=1 Tax=Paenibacillus sp. 1P03SA TaxID=3132294 RepID=UPI0039A07FB0